MELRIGRSPDKCLYLNNIDISKQKTSKFKKNEDIFKNPQI
jgi:hypothetical protein